MSSEITPYSPQFAPEGGQSWLEIDLDIIRRNALAVKNLLRPGCGLMAVVKANGYGLGAAPIALALEDIAQMLGVTNVYEAIELRQSGVSLPILVFLPPCENTAALYGEFKLSATIDSPQGALLLNSRIKTPVSCHLKINTGMNRLGASAAEVSETARAVASAENLKLKGVYSHFYNSPAPRGLEAQKQLEVFKSSLKSLEETGLRPSLAHMANSAAIIRLPQSHFEMVRCGTLLYGQSPVSLPPGLQLEDPFKARCRIAAVRSINKGEKVGYGGDFISPCPKKLAVLPIGYSDGFGISPPCRPGLINALKSCLHQTARALAKKPQSYGYLKGLRLPLAGRIAMQTSILDISRAPFLKTGDTIGISLRRVNASPLLKRIYLKEGRAVTISELQKTAPHEG